MTPGIMETVTRDWRLSAKGMDGPLDRICLVSYDEVSLDARLAYDQAEDQLMAASKMFVVVDGQRPVRQMEAAVLPRLGHGEDWR